LCACIRPQTVTEESFGQRVSNDMYPLWRKKSLIHPYQTHTAGIQQSSLSEITFQLKAEGQQKRKVLVKPIRPK